MKAEIKRLVPPCARPSDAPSKCLSSGVRQCVCLLILAAFSAILSPEQLVAQQKNYKVWGDVKVDDSKSDTPGPSTLTVILYDPTGNVVGRQNVSSQGRYRFNVMMSGDGNVFGAHEIAIETDAGEITRERIVLNGPDNSDFRKDFEFEWKSRTSGSKTTTGVVSAADVYNRPAATKSTFQKAQEAAEKKKFEQAVTLLRQIVDSDKLDFQAWTLLGMVYLAQEKPADAEKAYLSAIEARPAFALALLNLGRLRSSQKKFAEAINPLTRAVEVQPESAEANFLLGEAYLQIRKGSKAIPYLNEAARRGRPEAHLRLGWLYNAAGMKDKAAAEYEEFIKKRPDYSDRKKLAEYINANKKG
jgi:Tfp pilus assembly protein PilF